jgi:putative tryptophan/tyrosine transport system substrate-binding protein
MRRREFIKGLAGAAFAVRPAAAQQTAKPVVGFLSTLGSGPMVANRIEGFVQGLSEMQFVPGQNVVVEYRWAEGRYDRLGVLAEELVRSQVAVIVAPTQDSALAAKAATTTIPIVFNMGGDPVRFGLVASMNRPGGNATGVSMFSNQLEAKRLGLLHELVPKAAAIGILINPNNASAEIEASEVETAARSLGVQALIRHVSRDSDLEPAFDNLAQAGAHALMGGADPFIAGARERLVALAAKHSLPAIWEWPDFVEGGGLMSYGTSIVDSYRQVGVYTGRVLKGEVPADLPIQQSVKFVLAINLQTAKSLGIDVSPTLLARADQVVE